MRHGIKLEGPGNAHCFSEESEFGRAQLKFHNPFVSGESVRWKGLIWDPPFMSYAHSCRTRTSLSRLWFFEYLRKLIKVWCSGEVCFVLSFKRGFVCALGGADVWVPRRSFMVVKYGFSKLLVKCEKFWLSLGLKFIRKFHLKMEFWLL